MKKILSVVLAVLIIFSALSLGVVAETEEKVPVVILQGYSGPDLAYADENGEPIFDENGNVQLAWPLNFDNLGADITELLTGQVDLRILFQHLLSGTGSVARIMCPAHYKSKL